MKKILLTFSGFLFLALSTFQCTNAENSDAGDPATKEEGVYVARGNEPFWNVEVVPGESITWTTPEGSIKMPYVQPIMDKSMRPAKRYNVRTEANEFGMIVRTGQECTDSMSGHKAPDIVEVRLNGKDYKGCGGPKDLMMPGEG